MPAQNSGTFIPPNFYTRSAPTTVRTVLFNSTTSWLQFPLLPHTYFCLKVFLSLVFDFYPLFFFPSSSPESSRAFIFTTHSTLTLQKCVPRGLAVTGRGCRWISKAITSYKKTLFLADTYSRDVLKALRPILPS